MILLEETTITLTVVEVETKVVVEAVSKVDMLEVGATITNNLQDKVNKGNMKIP